VINPNRSVTVLGDSGVGPYDGGDDTLVGVQNNSSSPVTAITVSGPTRSGIFGFDGDGLCRYVSVTCGVYGYEGPNTTFVRDPANFDHGEVDFAAAGLGAHMAAYYSLEGALNSAALTAREGTLAGRYVALGDSFSSGEGAVGDSASHASGLFDPKTDTNGKPTDPGYNSCHRSGNAYPYAVAAAQGVTVADFTFRACSGAIMADLVANLPHYPSQWNEGPQLDAIGPAPQPKTGYLPPASLSTTLVTLSVGGNDAGFSDILANCITGFGSFLGGNLFGTASHCVSHAEADLAKGQRLLNKGGEILLNQSNNSWKFCGTRADETSYCEVVRKLHIRGATVVKVPDFASLLEMIQQRAPNAEIRVLLYPDLFTTHPAAKCTIGTFDSQGGPDDYSLESAEIKELNSLVERFDGTIGGDIIAAALRGVRVVPVATNPEFVGHALCDTAPAKSQTPWINKLVYEPGAKYPSDFSPFSFHPNARGQAQFGLDMNR